MGVKEVTLVGAQAYAWGLCHEVSAVVLPTAHDRRPVWCDVVWCVGSADVGQQWGSSW